MPVWVCPKGMRLSKGNLGLGAFQDHEFPTCRVRGESVLDLSGDTELFICSSPPFTVEAYSTKLAGSFCMPLGSLKTSGLSWKLQYAFNPSVMPIGSQLAQRAEPRRVVPRTVVAQPGL